MITYIFVFILGLIVGSFLNVCIWRLPKGESVIRPWSHCPSCLRPLPWYDNIPLLSFVILRARCRFCRGKISCRYPLVELITAILFLLLLHRFGFWWGFFKFGLLCCGLIISSFIDIEHRIIPDVISIGGIAVGLGLGLLEGFKFSSVSYNLSSLSDSFLGVIAGGGTIYITGLIGDAIFKKESMGGGDVKLLAMVGAFLGWKLTLLTFFIAPFFGSVVGIVLLLKKKSHLIPYGPFLSLGAVVSLFWGEKILSWILY